MVNFKDCHGLTCESYEKVKDNSGHPTLKKKIIQFNEGEQDIDLVTINEGSYAKVERNKGPNMRIPWHRVLSYRVKQ